MLWFSTLLKNVLNNTAMLSPLLAERIEDASLLSKTAKRNAPTTKPAGQLVLPRKETLPQVLSGNASLIMTA